MCWFEYILCVRWCVVKVDKVVRFFEVGIIGRFMWILVIEFKFFERVRI